MGAHSLLSPAPRPRSLPWRAEDALSLRRGLSRPLPPPQQGRLGSPAREAKSGDPVAKREPWSSGRLAPSLQRARRAPGRAAAAGPVITLLTLLPQPLARGEFRSPLRREEPPRRLVGSCDCIVLDRARRSRPTRFCGEAARGGVTVVSCWSEPGGYGSPECPASVRLFRED